MSENLDINLLENSIWNQSEPENITIVQDGLDKKEKWSRVNVMCLLEIIWEQYDKAKDTFLSRKIVFEQVSKEMKNNGFNYTRRELMKKYSNLTETYQRIRSRTSSKKNNLNWPYYEIMKEIRERERKCRLHLRTSSEPKKRKKSHSSSLNDIISPLKRGRSAFSNHLSSPSGGIAITSSEDIQTLSNQWQAKRLSLEDYKMELVEALFKDVKQQRTEAEEDAAITLQMHNAKNKHLKQVVAEMAQWRMDVKKELMAMSETINDLVAAIRNSGNTISIAGF